jgi:hypothetical protein
MDKDYFFQLIIQFSNKPVSSIAFSSGKIMLGRLEKFALPNFQKRICVYTITVYQILENYFMILKYAHVSMPIHTVYKIKWSRYECGKKEVS